MDKKQRNIIHLLIVDDHPMVRDGIRQMLKSGTKDLYFELEEADNGEEAVSKVIHGNFDVIIVDYQLPEITGDRVIESLLLYKPGLKILAVSNYDQLAYIQKMIAAGAHGYVLKSIEPPELLRAIKTILEGKVYYSSEVALKLLDAPKHNSRSSAKENKYGLTRRELEVLKLIAEEKTNEEIAGKLFLAKRTIDTHRQRILNKVQARNTAGLIKAAYELKLI